MVEGTFMCGDESTCSSFASDAKSIVDGSRSEWYSASSASTEAGEPPSSDVDDAFDGVPECNMICIDNLDTAWEQSLRFCELQLRKLPAQTHEAAQDTEEPGAEQALSTEAFTNFAPLLRASQRYARSSGCRFQKEDFDGLPDEVKATSSTSSRYAVSDDLQARSLVVPAIIEMFSRFRAGEHQLLEDLDRATDIMMSEASRNGKISALKASDLWPPNLSLGTQEACQVPSSFVSAAFELHRSEREREMCTSRVHEEKRLALTASYIVEFAEALGIPVTPLADLRLQDFHDFNEQLINLVSNLAVSRKQVPEPPPSTKHPLARIDDAPQTRLHEKYSTADFGQRERQHLLTLEEFLMVSTSGPMLPGGEMRLLEDFLSAAKFI